MPFQTASNVLKFSVSLRHFVGQQGDSLGRANSGDHVLSLSVDQILAIKHFLARRGITGERYSGSRRLSQITEDHGLDVNRRAPFHGDAVTLAVEDCALVFPRLKHGADGPPKLFVNILREGRFTTLFDQAFVAPNQLAQIRRAELAVLRDTEFFLEANQQMMKWRWFRFAARMYPHNHFAIHLDKPAIAIPRKARILCAFGKAFDCFVIQA